MGRYNALDIAKHIIKCFDEKGEPISNLKLQKLLYFAWIEYYNKKKEYLFSQPFEAWRFGPVVPDVYYEYSIFGGLPIFLELLETIEESGCCIEESDAKILEKPIDAYLNKSVFEMVKETHKVNGAWDCVYSGNPQNKKEIPFITIIEKECR